MRILVTNDDGYGSDGIEVLRRLAEEISSDVWVVAPEKNQSGASHSMTLHEPLRVRQVNERGFMLRGTPTDCVLMAVRHFLIDQPPDLILSGINHGSNLAEDVAYSGTIAAASEGAMLGIRSIAMSQVGGSLERGRNVYWDTPLTHGPGLLTRLLKMQSPADVVLNVNYPDCPPEAVAGVEITRQGRRDQASLKIDERADPWGMPYYWFNFQRPPSSVVEGSDLAAIDANRISVTPLSLNRTDDATRKVLAGTFNA
ncbi:5'/3'-nucleotidase SurE [Hyphomicrobium sulfonivorans]|uniref:5'-nucleotidase SurE n=1 Tax=Hyphomicrobium sulfonivorans TaxID=121290 RepID=A0A109BJZ9_HYPSL|nr:5'/3'-nucleotidase SurE [Hyphomicrobium sulfonivorans]KWT69377.1 5-nucleotidase SurE [Hyphomicrobium sulfonivorans]MBI1651072.1 5'/3'-nucleotidase SurE [Hyphomicrobium sulfonivorans]NSL72545.1 5'/3'-nucleotidase SurE [Hyphomicrobium sulfonivorans]